MSIAPILHSVEVKSDPGRTFELFTGSMGRWWPKNKSVGRHPFADVVIEPRVGGRWFERDVEGNERQWGKVLAWEPPRRALLAWQLNTQWTYESQLVTEVELTFAPVAGGGTRVTLQHRNLERFGTDAESHAGKLGGGWPSILADFTRYSDTSG